MQTVTKNVSTGTPRKIVGTVDCPIYENLEELQEAETVEQILNMFNKANVIRLQGNERAKHQTKKAGKNLRFDIGFNLLWEVLGDDAAKQCIGNIEKLREAIASPEIQTAIDEYIASQKNEAIEAAEE